MKKSSYIQRLAVGLALLFATSNYTYAQFGGLLNAAKKKAQEKVEKAVDKKAKEQADPQRNLPSAGQTTAHRGWSQVGQRFAIINWLRIFFLY